MCPIWVDQGYWRAVCVFHSSHQCEAPTAGREPCLCSPLTLRIRGQ